jgi:hypothetical protein
MSPVLSVISIIVITKVVISKVVISKVVIRKVVITKVVISKVVISKVVISKVVISKIVISKLVTSKVVINKVVISKIVISKVVICKVVISIVVVSIRDTSAEKAVAFSGKYILPSIIFVGKPVSLLKEKSTSLCSTLVDSCPIHKYCTTLKSLTETNTLAYFAGVFINDEKRCINLHHFGIQLCISITDFKPGSMVLPR